MTKRALIVFMALQALTACGSSSDATPVGEPEPVPGTGGSMSDPQGTGGAAAFETVAPVTGGAAAVSTSETTGGALAATGGAMATGGAAATGGASKLATGGNAPATGGAASTVPAQPGKASVMCDTCNQGDHCDAKVIGCTGCTWSRCERVDATGSGYWVTWSYFDCRACQ